MYELIQLTGKGKSALYAHLARLSRDGWLRWRIYHKGVHEVSFLDCPSLASPDEPAVFSDDDRRGASIVLENGRPPSAVLDGYFPPSEFSEDIGPAASVSADEFQKNGRSSSENPENSPLSLNPPDHNLPYSSEEEEAENFRKIGRPGGAGGGTAGPADKESRVLSPTPDAVEIYTHLTHLIPTPPQREELYAQVRDLGGWEAAVEHWLLHGWNPRNILGMLNLYAQGGPAACRRCTPDSRSPAGSASVLDALLAEAERKSGEDWDCRDL